MWPFYHDWEFSCAKATPSHGKTATRCIQQWDRRDEFLKVTFIIGNVSGYFKELSKMIRDTDHKKIRHIRLGKQELIKVQDKCDNLDDKIELGLQMCKLIRQLDEIGTLIVLFFW